MDEYLKAKMKLFNENLLPNGIAVINADIVNIDFIKLYLNERKSKLFLLEHAEMLVLLIQVLRLMVS